MELAKIANDLNYRGLNSAPLKMPTPNFRGAYPERVRTPFGLCRWCPLNGKEITIFVTAFQIQKFLKKLLKEEKAADRVHVTLG